MNMLATSYLGSVWEWLGDGEHWHGTEGVPHRLIEHIEMSAASLTIAVLIAIPIGVLLGHLHRGGFVAINVANLGRAIPAFAILMFGVLVWGIGDPPQILRSIGAESLPTFVALVALAIPPMLTNTFIAIGGVDAEVRNAARGMGMNERQVLQRVELPLATPVIMAGVRTSAVAVVATATLAAYVGAGGLGRFIIDGAAIDRTDPRIFVGAVLVAVLSVVAELTLAAVQRFVVPKALRHVVDVAAPDDRVAIAA